MLGAREHLSALPRLGLLSALFKNELMLNALQTFLSRARRIRYAHYASISAIFCCSSAMNLLRPHNLRLARPLRPLRAARPMGIRTLAFKRIEITNPFGVRLVKLSRMVLKGIFLFYGGLVGVGIVAGGVVNYYLNRSENLGFFGLKMTFSDVLLLKAGLYNELISKRYILANEFYMVFLRSTNDDFGVEFDKTLESLKQFPTTEQLKSKGQKWVNRYVDILLRCAIVKGQLGQLQAAKELVEKAVELSSDSRPDKVLLSNGYRLLAKVGGSKEEEYLKASVALLGSANLNQQLEAVSRDLYNAVVDLGIYYSRTGQSQLGFELFLNNLMFLESYQEPSRILPDFPRLLDELFGSSTSEKFIPDSGDVPLMKLYLSELLWVQGRKDNAINWCKSALIESFNFSRQNQNCAVVAKMALDDLILMYTRLNKNGAYTDKIRNCQDLAEDIYIPQKALTGWGIFFSDMI